jgi:hypothetical protein
MQTAQAVALTDVVASELPTGGRKEKPFAKPNGTPPVARPEHALGVKPVRGGVYSNR